MHDEQTRLPDDSPAKHTPASNLQPQSRLGIIHLMIWVLGSAIILSIGRLFDHGDRPAMHRTIVTVYYGLTALINGAAVGSILIWLARLVRRGPPFPVLPGHYLLMLQGGSVGVQWLFYGVVELSGQGSEQPRSAFFIAWALGSAISAALALVCAILCPRPPRWLAFFLAYVVVELLQAMVALFTLGMLSVASSLLINIDWLIPISSLLPLACVLVAAWRDRSGRAPHDWLHWTGIAVFVAGLIAYWLATLALWLTTA